MNNTCIAVGKIIEKNTEGLSLIDKYIYITIKNKTYKKIEERIIQDSEKEFLDYVDDSEDGYDNFTELSAASINDDGVIEYIIKYCPGYHSYSEALEDALENVEKI
jgi:hypothetical protein